MKPLSIPLHKPIIFLQVFVFTGFGIGCVFMFKYAEAYDYKIDADVTRVISIIGVLLFTYQAVHYLFKLLFRSEGVRIDQETIYDNSSYYAAGVVLRSDITHIEYLTNGGKRYVVVYVINPQEYIEKSFILKKQILKMTQNMFGSPIAINATSLVCTEEELEKHFRVIEKDLAIQASLTTPEAQPPAP